MRVRIDMEVFKLLWNLNKHSNLYALILKYNKFGTLSYQKSTGFGSKYRFLKNYQILN